MSLITKGDAFPLSTALSDGRMDKYVRAILFDSSVTQIGLYDLPHISSGIYSRDDIISTNTGKFLVKYIVYRDSSFNKLDTRYAQKIVEIHVEDYVNEILNEVDNSDGRIT